MTLKTRRTTTYLAVLEDSPMNVFKFEAQIEAAESRHQECEKQRKARDREVKKKTSASRQWWQIDEQERIQRRLESKGLMAEAQAVAEWRPGQPLNFDPFERIISDNELTSVTTLFNGAAVARGVGRIVIRAASGRIRGFGTGFLVSGRLLLTNNHVLGSVAEARPSSVEFFFWEDLAGRTGPVAEFELEPDVFFETSEGLDFSLVALQAQNAEGMTSKRLGWSPLIARSGKSTVGEPVNIVQHPAGEPQQVVLRENTITDVVGNFLHYEADTRRGSSGSPVYNVDWELAALHHAGVPERRNGRIVLNDGRLWNGRSETAGQISWIANEGVRVSRIVDELRLREPGWDSGRFELFQGCFEARPRFDELIPDLARKERPARETASRGDIVSLRLPSRVDLHLDSDGTASIEAPDLEPGGALDSTGAGGLSRESVDRDYSNRRGYRPRFLGSGFSVPMPTVASEPQARELDYHHFTVVMNRERRLAWLTGCNIHGRQLQRIPRTEGQTGWVFDTRIPNSDQIGNDLYKHTPIDRGHLVRRIDPSWGHERHLAMRGNDDTFHYTNSAPQHADFNEDHERWAGLEDYYLDNLEDRNRKASVFTGPVFREHDPVFRTVRIPRQYWKILVYRKGGALTASAYLLSQEAILRDDLGLEDFGDGRFELFQVEVSEIEGLTEIDFGDLSDVDSFGEGTHEGLLLELSTGRRIRRIEDLDEIEV